MYRKLSVRSFMRNATSTFRFFLAQYALRRNFKKSNVYVFQDIKPEEADSIAHLFSFLVMNDIDYSGIRFVVNCFDGGIKVLPENQIVLSIFHDIHPGLILRHILCYFDVSVKSLYDISRISKLKQLYLFDSDPIEFEFSYTCEHSNQQRTSKSQFPDGIYALNIQNPTTAMIAYREDRDVVCSEDDIQKLLERALNQ